MNKILENPKWKGCAWEYVRLTMLANYWHAIAPSNEESLAKRRGNYLDTLASKALYSIEHYHLRDIAREMYHEAYRSGKRHMDYVGL